MLMKDVFEAVDRAFIQGAGRNPDRPEPKTSVELPQSASESSPSVLPSERRRQPESRCHVSNFPLSRRGIAENGSRFVLGAAGAMSSLWRWAGGAPTVSRFQTARTIHLCSVTSYFSEGVGNYTPAHREERMTLIAPMVHLVSPRDVGHH